jgi:hypothetical protein
VLPHEGLHVPDPAAGRGTDRVHFWTSCPPMPLETMLTGMRLLAPDPRPPIAQRRAA